MFGSIPSLDAAEERFEDVTTPRLFQGRPTHLACDTRRNRDFHEETERNGEVLWGTLNASSYTKKQQLFIFSVVNYQLLVTCGKSFRFPKGRHPSVCRYGTARTGNLLSMRLPLLLEMAGTCYIITEGGKTHTFQHYLYQETHTENIPTALNSETFQGRLEQRGRSRESPIQPHKRSHLNAPGGSLISHHHQERPGATHTTCSERKREKKHSCKFPLVAFVVWGLASTICNHQYSCIAVKNTRIRNC